jgi:MBG domain (YGX type)
VTLTSAGAAATATVAGSPYSIVPSAAVGARLNNYSIAYGTGSLKVKPAPLTIIADNKTMSFGGAIPALTASYFGFVNGTTPASLATAVQLSTSVTNNSQAGAYPITIVGGSSPDYSINYLNGTVTEEPYVPPAKSRYRAAAAFVTTLYNMVVGSGPVPVGFMFWMRRYLVGEPPLKITRGFAQTTQPAPSGNGGGAPSISLRVVCNDALAAARRAGRSPSRS